MKKGNNIKFYIKKFSFRNEFSQQILNEIPMLTRRKLSNLDKLALTNILNIYSPEIENIVFSSQYGEFERLFKLIEQYSTENEVSPIQFSSSVHNTLTGIICRLKNLTKPYYAISSGENSLSNGLIHSIITNKETLFCYSDNFNTNQSVACIISDKPDNESIEIIFKKKFQSLKLDEYKDFIKFLKNESKEFQTNIGVFLRND